MVATSISMFTAAPSSLPSPSSPSSLLALSPTAHPPPPSELTTLDVLDAPIRAPDEVAAALSARCTHPAFALLSARAHDGAGVGVGVGAVVGERAHA